MSLFALLGGLVLIASRLDSTHPSGNWLGSLDVELANGSGLIMQDSSVVKSGSARVISGVFRGGLTFLEKKKTKALLWLIGMIHNYTVDERAVRSVVLLDGIGESPWYAYARRIHRQALTRCSEWQETRSSAFLPVTAYSCADADVNTREGEKASKLLELFTRDLSVAAVLGDVYGMDASTCQHVREGVLISVQHRNMTPDTFHPDLCTGDQVPATHKGITVVVYPHDQWDPTWGGQFELQGPTDEPVAMVSPLPNRSVVIDGCIRHRATNAAVSAAPVVRMMGAPKQLMRLDRGRYTAEPNSTFNRWNQWRFALVMQLGCPWLGGQPPRQSVSDEL